MLPPGTTSLQGALGGPVAVVLGLSPYSILGGGREREREREHVLISAVAVLTRLSLYRDIMAH